jgi:lipid A 4'-phosphatase
VTVAEHSGRSPGVRWAVAGLATALLAAGFVWFAGIDLWFTGLFWNGTDGFFLRDAWWVRTMYRIIPILSYSVVGIALIGLIVTAVRRRPLGPWRSRMFLYLIAVVAIGPGLVVNVVFKDHWGRARPRDVVEFGGTKAFTPAFVISDQCPKNCSFVAGHPSMAFAMVALALVAASPRPSRRRAWLIALVVAAGMVVGFGRIVQGGHFLSDVIFSAIFTVAVAVGLYRLFGLDPVSSGLDRSDAPSVGA